MPATAKPRLRDLPDVDGPSFAAGEVPVWDGAKFTGQPASGGGADASTTVKGISKLSVAPAVASDPIAAGTNDPRMTDSRTPTAHSHVIADVTALQTGLDAKQATAQKDQAGGYPGLDGAGKIASSQMPALALTDVWVVATEAAQLALTAQEGDVAIRSDLNRSYVQNGGVAGTMADWSELLTPPDAVLSVAGKTGVVSLVKADVGLGNVDNTSDAAKPVSTAQQAALDARDPWGFDILAFTEPSAVTNWSIFDSPVAMLNGGYRRGDGSNNQSIAWDRTLSAGTWKLALLHYTGSNRGIYTVDIDGTTVGTVDSYSSGGSINTLSVITGIVIATTGKKRIRLTNPTKNAASSLYHGLLQGVSLVRTA